MMSIAREGAVDSELEAAGSRYEEEDEWVAEAEVERTAEGVKPFFGFEGRTNLRNELDAGVPRGGRGTFCMLLQRALGPSVDTTPPQEGVPLLVWVLRWEGV